MVEFTYKKYRKFSISRRQAGDIVDILGREIETRKVKFNFIVPIGTLFQLPDEMKSVMITKGIELRYLTTEESIYIRASSQHYAGKGDDVIGLVGSVDIPVSFTLPGKSDRTRLSEINELTKILNEIWERIELILSAFLIEKTWSFEIGILHFISKEPLIYNLNFSCEKNRGSKFVSCGSYEPSEKDLKQVQKNIKRLHELGPKSFLIKALNRLVESSFRYKPEESIVDSIIACETILLHQQGDREMKTFKMALNYSVLDESVDGREKLERYNQLNEMIRFRNKLVHGEEASISEAKKHAEISKDILRNCVRLVLEVLDKTKNMKKGSEFWKDFYLKRLYQIVDE
jgi:hypothetical protein